MWRKSKKWLSFAVIHHELTINKDGFLCVALKQWNFSTKIKV